MRDILCKQGLTPVEASDGQQALDIFFSSNDIELLILDVMMPKHDGWEVLKCVREQSDVPVLMLTALGDEQHEVLGLGRGADDYISKPFSYQVFVARVNALLRKAHKERQQAWVFGELLIDAAGQKVTVGGCEVEISHKEWLLLTYLVINSGRVLMRDQILDRVWGYDFQGDPRTIDTHIKTLRSKLLTAGRYIRTVRGSGYMFEPDKS